MRAGPVGVDVRDAEGVVARDRQLGHPHARCHRGQTAPLLVGRVAGGDKVNEIQVELIARFLGQNQVADMNRIKRAAKHSDARICKLRIVHDCFPVPRFLSPDS